MIRSRNRLFCGVAGPRNIDSWIAFASGWSPAPAWTPLAKLSMCRGRSPSAGAIKSTKTGLDRHVELTPRLMAALRRMAHQVPAVAAGREMSWIFPSLTGGTLRVQIVNERFRRLRGQARNTDHHRIFDLRHTYASHALMLRAPI